MSDLDLLKEIAKEFENSLIADGVKDFSIQISDGVNVIFDSNVKSSKTNGGFRLNTKSRLGRKGSKNFF